MNYIIYCDRSELDVDVLCERKRRIVSAIWTENGEQIETYFNGIDLTGQSRYAR